MLCTNLRKIEVLFKIQCDRNRFASRTAANLLQFETKPLVKPYSRFYRNFPTAILFHRNAVWPHKETFKQNESLRNYLLQFSTRNYTAKKSEMEMKGFGQPSNHPNHIKRQPTFTPFLRALILLLPAV